MLPYHLFAQYIKVQLAQRRLIIYAFFPSSLFSISFEISGGGVVFVCVFFFNKQGIACGLCLNDTLLGPPVFQQMPIRGCCPNLAIPLYPSTCYYATPIGHVQFKIHFQLRLVGACGETSPTWKGERERAARRFCGLVVVELVFVRRQIEYLVLTNSLFSQNYGVSVNKARLSQISHRFRRKSMLSCF